MNIALPANIDKPAFLAWVQTQERQRYELVNGSVMEITHNTRGHARITANLLSAFDKRLGREGWDVLGSFGLETGPITVRDPDILVDRGGAAGDVITDRPVLLGEVLSPSSATTDLGDKLAEYLKIPSLLAYFVLSQDEPKAWVWVRDQSGFPAGAEVIAGDDGIIRIPALSVELPLAEIYRDYRPTETDN